MKNLFLYCTLMAATAAGCHSTSDNSSLPVPANVILIMTDDQGYGDLACHGNPHIRTPNLDKLHAESIRFTDFHVGTTCAPTRAGLLTGRNCNRVGVWHTIAGRSQLRSTEQTIADVFGHNGYRTGMFGKWHLGDNYPFLPQYRGFSETLYHGGGGVVQGPDYWDNDYFDDTYFRNGQPEKQQGYCTDVWFDAAMEFIERDPQQPFFCYLATNAPHGPFYVDSSYIDPYLGNDAIPNPNFYGMITNFDDNLGRLMEKLEELGISDNTILLYLTDNGTAAGVRLDQEQFRTQGYNAGMRGQKGSQYEGGHRVPLFLRWPQRGLDQGRDVSELTAHVDILPTLIDLLDLDAPKQTAYDGTSLQPLLDKEEPSGNQWENRVLITDTQRAETPVKWKKCATMMGKWRLIDGKELYDISSDPEQKIDIASEHPEIRQRLRSAYEDWWTELEPTFEAPTRTILGSEQAPEVILYSHDWHEAENELGQPNLNQVGGHVVPWNHRQIRQGMQVNGYWEVELASPGTYTFELRRWPREAAQSISGSLPVLPAVDGGKEIAAGKALAITEAGIEVAEAKASVEVKEADRAAIFELELPAGPTRLKTFFRGPEHANLGAYYVYVRKS